jgi:transcriptional regulator with XRE-family HTH domain
MVLHSRIKDVRGHLTQQAFAAKLDVHFRTVQRWEAGTRLPCADDLLKMQQQFGISIDWLLSGAGPKYLRAADVEKRPGEPDERRLPAGAPPVVRLEDAPVERIKMWLDELIAENTAYRGWLDIEFPKRFPEYREWTEKKRQTQLLENSEPLTENSA